MGGIGATVEETFADNVTGGGMVEMKVRGIAACVAKVG